MAIWGSLRVGRALQLTSGTGPNGGFMVLMASFLVIKAHVPGDFSLPADRRPGQAGTGGARSRAIRVYMRPREVWA